MGRIKENIQHLMNFLNLDYPSVEIPIHFNSDSIYKNHRFVKNPG